MRVKSGLIHMYTAAALVAFSLAAPAAAGTREGDNAALVRIDLSNLRIDNFGSINPQYYRGAQPNGRDYADLASLGIKAVIDLTKDGDRREELLVQTAGMKFYRIPMTTHETPSAENVARFLKLVNDPANQPVYVHCQGGRHRTGVMTALYRMTADHWTADRAFAEMKRYNFGPDFLHPEFKQFVYAYPTVLARAAASQTVVAPAAKIGG